MIKYFLLAFTLTTSAAFSFEKLPPEYLVAYGKKDAKVEIIQYFSLSCPHCVQLFKNDFIKIREQYINTGDLRYVFHPVPMDLTTVQFMCCLERLDENQKRVLLKVLLEELSLENPDFNVLVMKRGMEIFNNQVNDLDKETFVKSSNAFNAARDFITQEGSLKVVPSIQIGDRVIEKAPEYNFIALVMNKLFLKESDYEF